MHLPGLSCDDFYSNFQKSLIKTQQLVKKGTVKKSYKYLTTTATISIILATLLISSSIFSALTLSSSSTFAAPQSASCPARQSLVTQYQCEGGCAGQSGKTYDSDADCEAHCGGSLACFTAQCTDIGQVCKYDTSSPPTQQPAKKVCNPAGSNATPIAGMHLSSSGRQTLEGMEGNAGRCQFVLKSSIQI